MAEKLRKLPLLISVLTLFCMSAMAGGEPDLSFGTNGSTVLGGKLNSQDYAYAVAIQNDGKIIAAGNSFLAENLDIMLVRLRANGQPDSSFGVIGKVVTDLGLDEMVTDVCLQANGKIVVVGARQTTVTAAPNTSELFVVRYNPDGALDTTFGKLGKVFIKYGNFRTYGADCRVNNDEIIIVGGVRTETPESYDLLAKLHPNGSLNTSFGAGGIAVSRVDYVSFPGEFAQLPNGKFIVAGFGAFAGTPYKTTLARFHANGTLDTSFGQNGRVIFWVNSSAPLDSFTDDVAIDALGRIVIQAYDADQDMPVARFSPSGIIDTSFGIPSGQIQMGVATLPANTLGAFNKAVAIQSDGKVVTAGSYGNTFALARYTATGIPDVSFGNGGLQSVSFGASSSGAHKLAIQPDGRIIAVGFRSSSTTADFAIARFLP